MSEATESPAKAAADADAPGTVPLDERPIGVKTPAGNLLDEQPVGVKTPAANMLDEQPVGIKTPSANLLDEQPVGVKTPAANLLDEQPVGVKTPAANLLDEQPVGVKTPAANLLDEQPVGVKTPQLNLFDELPVNKAKSPGTAPLDEYPVGRKQTGTMPLDELPVGKSSGTFGIDELPPGAMPGEGGGSTDFADLPVELRVGHKLWKARLHGYEEALKMFQTPESCDEFAKFVPLVMKFVIDPNASAQEKGLEATLAFLENASSAAKTANDVVSGLVAKCISAPKARTRELANKIILKYVELERADAVSEELSKGIEVKQPKICTAALQIATQAIKEFGTHVVPVDPLLKKIGLMFEEREKTVRDGAKALILEIFRWMGLSIKRKLSSVKACHMAELELEFTKMMNGGQPQATRLIQSVMRLPKSKRPLVKTFIDHEVVEEEPMDLDEEKDILTGMTKKFLEDLEAPIWQERKEALDTLIKLVSVRNLKVGDYTEVMKVLKRIVQDDSNVMMVVLACTCIAGLANALRKNFRQYALSCLPVVIERFKEKKPFVNNALREAVDALFKCVTIDSIHDEVTSTIDNSRNPHTRKETMAFLMRCFSKCTPPQLHKKLCQGYVKSLAKLLTEPDPTIRDQAYEALGMMMKVIGDKAMTSLVADLEVAKQNKIYEFSERAVVLSKYNSAVKEESESTPVASCSTASPACVMMPALAPAPWVKRGLSHGEVYQMGVELFTEQVMLQLWDSDHRIRLPALKQFLETLKRLPESEISSEALIRMLSKNAGFNDIHSESMGVRLEAAKLIAQADTLDSELATGLYMDVARHLGDIEIALRAAQLLSVLAEVLSLKTIALPIMEMVWNRDNVIMQTQAMAWLAQASEEFATSFAMPLVSMWVKKAVQTGDAELHKAALALVNSMVPHHGQGLAGWFTREPRELQDEIQVEIDKRDGDEPTPKRKQGKHIPAKTFMSLEVVREDSAESLVASLVDEPADEEPAVVKPPPVTKTSPEKSKKVGSPIKQTPKWREDEEVEIIPLLQENMLKQQRFLDESKLKVLKWSFTNPRKEFVESLKDLMSNANVEKSLLIDLFMSDFKLQVKAIDLLIEDFQHSKEATIANLDLVLKYMTLRFFDTNPTVTNKCLEYLDLILGELAVEPAYTFCELEASAFIPFLVIKIGDMKDSVRSAIKALFQHVTLLYPPTKIFPFIVEGLKSKNARQRSECLDLLGHFIAQHQMASMATSIKDIARLIGDRDKTVRNASLNCLVQAWLREGDRLFKLIGQVSEKELSLLKERIKRSTKPILSVTPNQPQELIVPESLPSSPGHVTTEPKEEIPVSSEPVDKVHSLSVAATQTITVQFLDPSEVIKPVVLLKPGAKQTSAHILEATTLPIQGHILLENTQPLPANTRLKSGQMPIEYVQTIPGHILVGNSLPIPARIPVADTQPMLSQLTSQPLLEVTAQPIPVLESQRGLVLEQLWPIQQAWVDVDDYDETQGEFQDNMPEGPSSPKRRALTREMESSTPRQIPVLYRGRTNSLDNSWKPSRSRRGQHSMERYLIQSEQKKSVQQNESLPKLLNENPPPSVRASAKRALSQQEPAFNSKAKRAKPISTKKQAPASTRNKANKLVKITSPSLISDSKKEVRSQQEPAIRGKEEKASKPSTFEKATTVIRIEPQLSKITSPSLISDSKKEVRSHEEPAVKGKAEKASKPSTFEKATTVIRIEPQLSEITSPSSISDSKKEVHSQQEPDVTGKAEKASKPSTFEKATTVTRVEPQLSEITSPSSISDSKKEVRSQQEPAVRGKAEKASKPSTFEKATTVTRIEPQLSEITSPSSISASKKEVRSQQEPAVKGKAEKASKPSTFEKATTVTRIESQFFEITSPSSISDSKKEVRSQQEPAIKGKAEKASKPSTFEKATTVTRIESQFFEITSPSLISDSKKEVRSQQEPAIKGKAEKASKPSTFEKATTVTRIEPQLSEITSPSLISDSKKEVRSQQEPAVKGKAEKASKPSTFEKATTVTRIESQFFEITSPSSISDSKKEVRSQQEPAIKGKAEKASKPSTFEKATTVTRIEPQLSEITSPSLISDSKKEVRSQQEPAVKGIAEKASKPSTFEKATTVTRIESQFFEITSPSLISDSKKEVRSQQEPAVKRKAENASKPSTFEKATTVTRIEPQSSEITSPSSISDSKKEVRSQQEPAVRGKAEKASKPSTFEKATTVTRIESQFSEITSPSSISASKKEVRSQQEPAVKGKAEKASKPSTFETATTVTRIESQLSEITSLSSISDSKKEVRSQQEPAIKGKAEKASKPSTSEKTSAVTWIEASKLVKITSPPSINNCMIELVQLIPAVKAAEEAMRPYTSEQSPAVTRKVARKLLEIISFSSIKDSTKEVRSQQGPAVKANFEKALIPSTSETAPTITRNESSKMVEITSPSLIRAASKKTTLPVEEPEVESFLPLDNTKVTLKKASIPTSSTDNATTFTKKVDVQLSVKSLPLSHEASLTRDASSELEPLSIDHTRPQLQIASKQESSLEMTPTLTQTSCSASSGHSTLVSGSDSHEQDFPLDLAPTLTRKPGMVSLDKSSQSESDAPKQGPLPDLAPTLTRKAGLVSIDRSQPQSEKDTSKQDPLLDLAPNVKRKAGVVSINTSSNQQGRVSKRGTSRNKARTLARKEGFVSIETSFPQSGRSSPDRATSPEKLPPQRIARGLSIERTSLQSGRETKEVASPEKLPPQRIARGLSIERTSLQSGRETKEVTSPEKLPHQRIARGLSIERTSLQSGRETKEVTSPEKLPPQRIARGLSIERTSLQSGRESKEVTLPEKLPPQRIARGLSIERTSLQSGKATQQVTSPEKLPPQRIARGLSIERTSLQSGKATQQVTSPEKLPPQRIARGLSIERTSLQSGKATIQVTSPEKLPPQRIARGLSIERTSLQSGKATIQVTSPEKLPPQRIARGLSIERTSLQSGKATKQVTSPEKLPPQRIARGLSIERTSLQSGKATKQVTSPEKLPPQRIACGLSIERSSLQSGKATKQVTSPVKLLPKKFPGGQFITHTTPQLGKAFLKRSLTPVQLSQKCTCSHSTETTSSKLRRDSPRPTTLSGTLYSRRIPSCESSYPTSSQSRRDSSRRDASPEKLSSRRNTTHRSTDPYPSRARRVSSKRAAFPENVPPQMFNVGQCLVHSSPVYFSDASPPPEGSSTLDRLFPINPENAPNVWLKPKRMKPRRCTRKVDCSPLPPVNNVSKESSPEEIDSSQSTRVPHSIFTQFCYPKKRQPGDVTPEILKRYMIKPGNLTPTTKTEEEEEQEYRSVEDTETSAHGKKRTSSSRETSQQTPRLGTLIAAKKLARAIEKLSGAQKADLRPGSSSSDHSWGTAVGPSISCSSICKHRRALHWSRAMETLQNVKEKEEVIVCTDAMICVDGFINSRKATAIDNHAQVNSLVLSIVHQMRVLSAEAKPQVRGINASLLVISSIIKHRALGRRVVRDTLVYLLRAVFVFIIDKRLGLKVKWSANMVAERIFTYGNAGSALGAILAIAHISVSGGDEGKKFKTEIIGKMNYVIPKINTNWSYRMNIYSVFAIIYEFFSNHKSAEWLYYEDLDGAMCDAFVDVIKGITKIVGRPILQVVDMYDPDGTSEASQLFRQYVESDENNYALLMSESTNYSLKEIFLKIGRKEEESEGIRDLFTFLLKHPTLDLMNFLRGTSMEFRMFLYAGLQFEQNCFFDHIEQTFKVTGDEAARIAQDEALSSRVVNISNRHYILRIKQLEEVALETLIAKEKDKVYDEEQTRLLIEAGQQGLCYTMRQRPTTKRILEWEKQKAMANAIYIRTITHRVSDTMFFSHEASEGRRLAKLKKKKLKAQSECCQK